ERDKDADFGFLAVDDVREVADHGDVHVIAALDRYDGFLRCLAFGFEVDQSIDSGVGSFFTAAEWNGLDPRTGPELKFMLISCRQIPGAIHVFRRAVNLILDSRKSIAQSRLYERDC